MIKRSEKVFIDSNMIIFAADFQKDNVLHWITRIYPIVYIHIDVYEELLSLETKSKVDELINDGIWLLFNPSELSETEQLIYKQWIIDVKEAFSQMNVHRIADGKPIKTVSNIGEIATIVACMMIGAGIICSNDFDIRTVIEQENYQVTIEGDDVVLVQDSAEDFCCHCYSNNITTRSNIRKFYKTIIIESQNRDQKLKQLDARLEQIDKKS